MKKSTKIGEFDDPIEAAKARDRVVRELHGEFAYLNFPEEFAQGLEDGDSQQGETTAADADLEAKPYTRTPPRYVSLNGIVAAHSSAVGRVSIQHDP